MIPLIMKVKIPRPSKKPFTLYIPFFIVWLIVFVLVLILLPFLLIGSLCTWHMGYGKLMLLSIPMLFELLWHLQGLVVDVESENDRVYFKFI